VRQINKIWVLLPVFDFTTGFFQSVMRLPAQAPDPDPRQATDLGFESECTALVAPVEQVLFDVSTSGLTYGKWVLK
jgi:hypothetical protein